MRVASQLNRHILAKLLWASFALSLAFSAINGWINYQAARARQQEQLQAVLASVVPSLSSALWSFNIALAQQQLDGLRHFPALLSADVVENKTASGKKILLAYRKNTDAAQKTTAALNYPLLSAQEPREEIAVLIIRLDEDLMQAEVWSETLRFASLIILELLTLAAMLSGLVSRIVSSPIRAMSQHVAALTANTLTIPAPRPAQRKRNELHTLADGITRLQSDLHAQLVQRDMANQQLEQRVAERTAELVDKNQQLEMLSISDRLTGLYNRLRLDQVLEKEFARFQRYGVRFALILLDVDHFKSVNDAHGHQVGDRVLVEVAQLLRRGTREADLVGRWGGEEFLIVCPDSDEAGAAAGAEKLRYMVAQHPFPTVGTQTCSFGVAAVRPDEGIDALIGRADAALYRAKLGGRNRVDVSH